jgi:hypothetical protein
MPILLSGGKMQGKKLFPHSIRRIRNFLTRSSMEQRLVLRAAWIVLGVRLGLWLLPSRVILRRIARLVHAAGGKKQPNSPELRAIVWAIVTVSEFIPRASCLTQALAAQVLLARHGYSSQLQIGVGRDEQGKLQAHAWVESAGRVVIGSGELNRFQRFPQIQEILLSRKETRP